MAALMRASEVKVKMHHGGTYMLRQPPLACGVAFFLGKMQGAVIDTLRLDR